MTLGQVSNWIARARQVRRLPASVSGRGCCRRADADDAVELRAMWQHLGSADEAVLLI